jgi:hypothetical protein
VTTNQILLEKNRTEGFVLFFHFILSDEEHNNKKEIPVATHARRASATVADRFSQNPIMPLSNGQAGRGTNVLRRLSLSSAFIKVATLSTHPEKKCNILLLAPT